MGGTSVLCVGWDGADLSTIDSLIARGRLPNLARLRESGLGGSLDGLPGLADDAHWSSFATSQPPDVHGRFHHEQPASGRYYQSNFPRDAMSVAPFWEHLAAAGLRVAVLDAPKSPLGQNPNLRVVADWMPHGADGPAPVSTPSGLVEELNARYGPPPPLECHRVIAPGEEEDVASCIRARLELRTRAALDWLEGEDWDLFHVVFAESHCIGHHCWHVHDPSHPEHIEAQRDRIGDVVEDIYMHQDQALGQLIAAAGPQAAVVVFSPLGMGPNYNGDALVQPVLDRLARRGPTEVPLWARAVRTVPRWARRGLPWLGRPARSVGRSPFRDLPYWHLRHDAISSAIRLNVVGRDPAGVIHPGSDFDHHRDLLTETFRSLTRVPAGTPAVADVVDVAKAFPGPAGDRFADLLVVWDTTAPIDEVSSPALGRIAVPPEPMRSGNHRTPGWSVLAGAGLEPRSLPRASLLDLGPTIADLLGAPLDGVRGRSLLDRASANVRV
jgi:predicted AlkP superfamily phosphohydrolase/phosphomutase